LIVAVLIAQARGGYVTYRESLDAGEDANDLFAGLGNAHAKTSIYPEELFTNACW
jgi:hypothetical protein